MQDESPQKAPKSPRLPKARLIGADPSTPAPIGCLQHNAALHDVFQPDAFVKNTVNHSDLKVQL